MNFESIPHDKIISAFERNVPDCYVRDYRSSGGYITICRGYKDIRWKDQMDAGNVYRQVPKETLCNLPRGNVTAPTKFRGLTLVRPGWRLEFRRAAKSLSYAQMQNITEYLGRGEVFQGVR